MSEPFLGEIKIVGFTFAPRGWAMCDGQLLPINQNQALFSLLGTTYGGDGRTTFALPELRGRVSRSRGQGPGLTAVNLGQRAGSEDTQLAVENLAPHSHGVTIPASNEDKDTSRPDGAVPARGGAYAAASDGSTLAAAAVASTGEGRAFTNLPPYLVLNHVIALQGLFPSRN